MVRRTSSAIVSNNLHYLVALMYAETSAMNHAFRCVQCGKAYSVPDHLAGRKVRCPACGRVQRIPSPSTEVTQQTVSSEYPLVDIPPQPAIAPRITPKEEDRVASARPSRSIQWRRFFRASALESSLLEKEIALLIALSVADLLVTHALLRRGPSFYESNPVAQWVFARWNIAGMTGFKFAAMGLVIVIGEVVERHRPGWGRILLAAACLATAAVVWQGLRLLLGYGHNGVAQF
jgi:phage FluMu protein Com